MFEFNLLQHKKISFTHNTIQWIWNHINFVIHAMGTYKTPEFTVD